MQHFNDHNHACPPISKPDYYALETFKQIVRNNPEKKPLKLVVGSTTMINDEKQSIYKIHPAFINRDRVTYYRKKELIEAGYKYTEDDSISSLVREKLVRLVDAASYQTNAISYFF